MKATENTRQTYADRLKALMTEHSLTQEDVAEMAGITQAAVSLWLTDSTVPYLKTLDRLCERLKVSPRWLRYGEGARQETPVQREERRANRVHRLDNVRLIMTQVRQAVRTISVSDPEVGEERVFAFENASDTEWFLLRGQVEAAHRLISARAEVSENFPVLRIPHGHELRPLAGDIAAGLPHEAYALSEEFVAVPTPLAAKVTFALRARGQSMIDKGINDGDIVLLNNQTEPRDGDVVAALIDGEVTLKTYAEEMGQAFLKSENAAFPPQIIPQEEMRIQGVMVGKLA